MTGADRLLAFIRERHAIYTQRALGAPWPWTEDPILRQYRFCNVYRNLDTQTQLIHRHWLKPHAKDPDVWFAMTVARLVNWWPTLAEVGYPVPWAPETFKRVLRRRKGEGLKVYTGAYMVRADAIIAGGKETYHANHVLQPMWDARADIRPHKGDTLESFHARLMEFRDMGSFMAAQIVADVKYAEGAPLRRAKDWDSWAAPGPGSLRGLNRVLGRASGASWKTKNWQLQFALLQSMMRPRILAAGLPFVTGQDLQNCLCEFDKHERVRLNEGRPRSLYYPTKREGVDR